MKQFYILIFLLISNHFNASAQATDYITGLDGPNTVCLDGSDLYYTDRSNCVYKVNVTDTDLEPITVICGLNRPLGLAIVGDHLYVGEQGEASVGRDSKIFKVDLTQNDPSLEVIEEGVSASLFVVYENYLIYGQPNNNRISKIDLTSSNPESITVISGSNRYFGTAIYGNDLYFSYAPGNGNNWFVAKIDITDDSPSPTVILDNNAGFISPLSLRFIENELFICDIIADKVFKTNVADSNPILTEVVSNVDGVRDCVAYNNTLYMAEINGDRISKLENFNLGVNTFNYNNIKIYPNPTTDYITVSNISTAIDFKIINSLGQFVKQGSISPYEKLDVHDLPKGVYMIILNDAFNKKFIKN